jgi:TRAP-type C4-dicarboxylate transport system permease small subunit
MATTIESLTNTLQRRLKESHWRLLRNVEANAEGYVAMGFLTVYAGIISFDVFQRLLSGNQSSWGLPVVLGLFTWMSWIAASWGVRKEAHFQFTLVRERLSRRTNYVLQYLDVVLWLLIMGVVFRFSVVELQTQMKTSRTIIATPIPNYFGYVAIPVGVGLLLVRVVQRIFIIRHKYHTGQSLEPESSIE